ncbi:MAG: alpha/beta fold hydrolase [Chloroflexi bacterium]|nr:alpha/beta fold hydrolase [Chloroflexota bacterium]
MLIEPGGIRIAVEVYGRGRCGRAALVCPGFFQSKDTATFRHMCLALSSSSRSGLDVIAMDFRGHGRSSGVFTFSALEDADLEAVIEWARREYPHLAIIGFSLGGAVALNTLARHPRAAQALVAVSAPSSFAEIEFRFWTPDAIRTGWRGLERGAGCRPGNPFLPKVAPIESVVKCGMPKLFVHGTGDPIVGVGHSYRLFAAAPEPRRLEVFEGGGHAEDLFRQEPERFVRLVRSWLDDTLPGA